MRQDTDLKQSLQTLQKSELINSVKTRMTGVNQAAKDGITNLGQLTEYVRFFISQHYHIIIIMKLF